ncbi:unnamed protein product [Cuscuta epithymum]|uniref:Uncharacterized protein n=1 Tax=Cuscuta epithymum TaxID=186058 RepID=A0AAV0C2X7_9ASTE|nr:unnamed protein product [Cuscuta epithymum]
MPETWGNLTQSSPRRSSNSLRVLLSRRLRFCGGVKKMDNNKGTRTSSTTLPMSKVPPIMEEGINLILSRWTALELALQQSGRPREKLASCIISLFINSRKEELCPEVLEDVLLWEMEEMKTIFEDEDTEIKEVASNIMRVHEGCMKGDYSFVERLRAWKPPAWIGAHVGKATVYESDDNSWDSDDSDAEDDVGSPVNNCGGTSNMMALDFPMSHPAAAANGGDEMAIDGDVCMSSQSTAEDDDDGGGWAVVARKHSSSNGRRGKGGMGSHNGNRIL